MYMKKTKTGENNSKKARVERKPNRFLGLELFAPPPSCPLAPVTGIREDVWRRFHSLGSSYRRFRSLQRIPWITASRFRNGAELSLGLSFVSPFMIQFCCCWLRIFCISKWSAVDSKFPSGLQRS